MELFLQIAEDGSKNLISYARVVIVGTGTDGSPVQGARRVHNVRESSQTARLHAVRRYAVGRAPTKRGAEAPRLLSQWPAGYCFSAPSVFESPLAPAPGARSTAPRPEVPAEPVAPGSGAGLAAAGAPDGEPLARSFTDRSVAEPRRSEPAVAGLRSACAGREALGVASASALPRWARSCPLPPEAEDLDD
jgi:hypothetical protein